MHILIQKLEGGLIVCLRAETRDRLEYFRKRKPSKAREISMIKSFWIILNKDRLLPAITESAASGLKIGAKGRHIIIVQRFATRSITIMRSVKRMMNQKSLMKMITKIIRCFLQ